MTDKKYAINLFEFEARTYDVNKTNKSFQF